MRGGCWSPCLAVLCMSAATAAAVRENSETAGGGEIEVDSSVTHLLLGTSGQKNTHATCNTAHVASTAAAEKALADGCDLDWQPKRTSLKSSTAVHVAANQLGDFAAHLRKLPEDEQVTLVVTGVSDPKMEVAFPAGLLADSRIVRVFRAVAESCVQPPCANPDSSTAAERQAQREEKLELLRTRVASAASAPPAKTPTVAVHDVASVPAAATSAAAVSPAATAHAPAAATSPPAKLADAKKPLVPTAAHVHVLAASATATAAKNAATAKEAGATPSTSAQSTSGTEACAALTRALEHIWGTHESALLTADNTGHRLAMYYNATRFNKTVPTTGEPYHYYHYYTGLSATYCEPITTIYPNGRKVIRYECFRTAYNGGGSFLLFIIYTFLFIGFIYLIFDCSLRTYRTYDGYEEPPSGPRKRRFW